MAGPGASTRRGQEGAPAPLSQGPRGRERPHRLPPTAAR